MALPAASACGAEEQTVDRIYGLMVLDDETIEWLLKTCPAMYCRPAVD